MKKLISLLLLLNFSIKAQEIKIGDQTWTSKNLNVSNYRNGDIILQVQDPAAWKNLIIGAWCYHENKPANGTKYGKLYNWYAVNDPRGLAPKGYHIPTDSEWDILTDYLGPEAGTKMKSTSGWDSSDGTKPCNLCKDWTYEYREGQSACKACANWTEYYRGSGNTCKLCNDSKIVYGASRICLGCKNSEEIRVKISGNGTNSSGFSGLPGDSRSEYGDFYRFGALGYWWSSSEQYDNDASTCQLYDNAAFAVTGTTGCYKRCGYSVRCIKD